MVPRRASAGAAREPGAVRADRPEDEASARVSPQWQRGSRPGTRRPHWGQVHGGATAALNACIS
jgi:hypothetical protein